jgi:hypothetical protein
MVMDNDLTAEILQEALNSAKSGKAEDLMSEMMMSLGEIGIPDGKMSKAYAVNPERDDTYITIYSTVNGVASDILRLMAPKVLSKVVKDGPDIPAGMVGKRAFSLTRGDFPEKPKFLCDLHKDNPKREWLDANGLAGIICRKANLASAYEVLRHRRFTHHDEHLLIDKLQNDERDNEMRDYQRSVMAILAKQAEGPKNVKSG